MLQTRNPLPYLIVTLALLTSCAQHISPEAQTGAQSVGMQDQPTDFAVGTQYDTTHVYVRPEDFDRFIASFVATFGGTTTKKGQFTVTPTESSTYSQLILSPVGTLSVFGFTTPIPYPFGAERTGYLVKDLDTAIAAARTANANVIVAPFPDPIGRDAVVQWPGGVNMQFYWHTVKPSYPILQTVPENRVYVSSDSADTFLQSWMAYAHGQVISDETLASGAEVGRPKETVRRVQISSGYGLMRVFVTDGHLPWPYGRELTGYQVEDLDKTLKKAQFAGATVLISAVQLEERRSAIVQFPGGYIAEIHSLSSH